MNKYNISRYNRLKQYYRICLGGQQLMNYPLLNTVWVFLSMGSVFFVVESERLLYRINVVPVLAPVFDVCMWFVVIIFPVICVIGIVQFIGCVFAIRDEADMAIVFGDKRDVKKQPPILVYKKKDRKTGVTKREFYTSIPMESWQEKKEAICDRMNIHLIGDITYGGRKKNKGHQIYFESAKGRKAEERGVLYDDIF